MVKITDEGLSKETRKLRKKKIMSENDNNSSSHKIKQRNMGRMLTRSSSHLSSAPTYANVTSKNNGKRKDNTSMSDSSEDSQTTDTVLEAPDTPIPRSNSQSSSSSDSAEDDGAQSEEELQTLVVAIEYDSLDEYCTDDLLEELEQLGPLRHKLADEPSTTRQKKQGSGNNKKSRRGSKKRTSHHKRRAQKHSPKSPQPPRPQYNHERTQALIERAPDDYWTYHAGNSNMIGDVNESSPLAVVHSFKDQGPVLGMTLSKDGTLLATFCTLGTINIWDVQNELCLLIRLQDNQEDQIDEFYCGLFRDQYLLAGGKLKDRHCWSVEDEDCHILPCPIKIFDMFDGKVAGQLDGHSEEVLCIKSLQFESKNYYVSTSQDGYIIKWQMDSDWKTLIESTRMSDGITCMAFSISFVPDTGNKYFMGACDAHLRLYDFEDAQLLQTFDGLYTSYCDCGKFIKWLDAEQYLADEQKSSASHLNKGQFWNQSDDSSLVDIESDESTHDQKDATSAFIITRGAEMVDGDVISIPNSCTLHQLIYPTKTGGLFELKEIRRYDHEGYRANSWMVKISTNGRYIFAPTMEGQVFVFNLLTGQVTGIIKAHEDLEVRDVILHPFLPLMFSCGDDGVVNVYSCSNLAE
ncbi:WD40-repeat-containing domain protein [Absidia repens]|uniref:WD40-repeat-containing domain protein n=1 Tax=Absidia repens TaxID=90262 RepID=A0A1X2ISP5_9FUNG|nr:WD40-repeat-containing domain protein [Absidia repens]